MTNPYSVAPGRERSKNAVICFVDIILGSLCNIYFHVSLHIRCGEDARIRLIGQNVKDIRRENEISISREEAMEQITLTNGLCRTLLL